MIDVEIRKRYEQWLESPVFDETTKYELAGLSEEEIIDRFYTDLSFGTSGVRGKLGAGTNRMNIYLIRRLSWSLGQALLAEDAADRGVVISYDSRMLSEEFALETALVLGAMGIKSYLFTGLRPTPELSFAVRHLEAAAGVMITASHNPKEYNGYKVYWEDGGQIPPHQADIITRFLNECPWDVPVLTDGQALEDGVLEYLSDYIDEAYQQCIISEMLNYELSSDRGNELDIVYTPLHGTGLESVTSVLDTLGYSGVTTIAEQATPDPYFSTVSSPNPEDSGAWNPALVTAARQHSDLLLATDPDADRLGVQCRKPDGTYYHFTGNQIGILLTNYILETLSSRGELPADGVVINNIVSTAMTSKLTESYGIENRIVNVGFKFIGEQIKKME
ncbi:MAG: phospho-sugar mutase, partial [Firmicutes bacterium]|nr:phospho-sugar mutase [Bacillota bacterium]